MYPHQTQTEPLKVVQILYHLPERVNKANGYNYTIIVVCVVVIMVANTLKLS